MKKIMILVVLSILVLGCSVDGSDLPDIGDTAVTKSVVSVDFIDPGVVYTETIELTYTITYDDSTTLEKTREFTATTPGATETFSITEEEVTGVIDVIFEDWRLIGTWTALDGTVVTFSQNGSDWSTNDNRLTKSGDQECTDALYRFESDGALYIDRGGLAERIDIDNLNWYVKWLKYD